MKIFNDFRHGEGFESPKV